MCLSRAYFVESTGERLLAESICGMVQNERGITLYDIIGRQITVKGMLKAVDLLENKVLIEPEKGE